MARQISQSAVSVCSDHPFSEYQYCGAVPWSDLWTAIDIPCYFRPKSGGSIFVQNNMGCLWQLQDLTTWLLHNIDFSKGDGLSIQNDICCDIVIFAVPLNFQNSIPGQPANNRSRLLTVTDGQTESNAYEPTVEIGQVGSKSMHSLCVVHWALQPRKGNQLPSMGKIFFNVE